MRKLALLMALLMVIGAGPAFALSATVDTFIENRQNSTLHPIADAGRILDVANQGIDKTYDAVKKPLEPLLKPVRKVRDEVFKATNGIWDIVTLRGLRNAV